MGSHSKTSSIRKYDGDGNLTEKKCSKCNVVKDVSEFHKVKGNKDSLSGSCKPCVKEKRKVYLEANKEKIKKRVKQYQEANKEKIKDYGQKYYDANNKRYRELRVKNKEKRKQYLEANKEKLREKKRQYDQANKKKVKEFYQKNKIELEQLAKNIVKLIKKNNLNTRKNIENSIRIVLKSMDKKIERIIRIKQKIESTHISSLGEKMIAYTN